MLRKEIENLIEKTIGKKAVVDMPDNFSYGDFSTNVAIKEKLNPQEIADKLKASPLFEKVEVVNGFINFFLSQDYLMRVLQEIKKKGNNYGRSRSGGGLRLQVEFVSANPTGPLTIAHGRQAAIGDSLANILEFTGYRVTREYYLNDEGTQMDILGRSIQARYRGLIGEEESFPEDGFLA